MSVYLAKFYLAQSSFLFKTSLSPMGSFTLLNYKKAYYWYHLCLINSTLHCLSSIESIFNFSTPCCLFPSILFALLNRVGHFLSLSNPHLLISGDGFLVSVTGKKVFHMFFSMKKKSPFKEMR